MQSITQCVPYFRAMKLILGLGLLLFVIHSTLGSYGPWEDIKKLYENIPYDKEGAETRHAEQEKYCSELTSSEEGLCYDDCMLRMGYGMAVLMEGVLYKASTYYVKRKLEEKLLKITDDRNIDPNTVFIPLYNDKLQTIIETCARNIDSFDIRGETANGFNWPGTTEVCIKFMTDEKQEKLTEVVACLKDTLKQ